MGAVLDKEGVVRRQDLQPYLSEDEAKALYEIKSPIDDPYIRSSVANSRYEAKGVAQPKAPPNDNYLLSSMAYDIFQSKELPTNPYLTKDIADGKYLTQTSGDGRYLTQLTADGRYLTQTSADGRYVTQTSGDDKYLTIPTADGRYLTENEAEDKFLTGVVANSTYALKADYLTKNTADGIYAPKGEYAPKADYLTKTTADNTYAPKLDYLTKPTADNIYAPKADYLTETTANNKFAPFGAYLTQEVADTKYAPVGAYLTKPTADTEYQPKGNYAPIGDYLTKTIADGMYQPKEPNGNLIANTIWNKSNDFMLGSNNDRGTFGNNMPGGRALVKDANTQLVMNFAGDFGGGVRIDGNNGLNVRDGGIRARNQRDAADSYAIQTSDAFGNPYLSINNYWGASNFNAPGRAVNFNTNTVNFNTDVNFNKAVRVNSGFNAPNAFADFYGVNLGANGVISRGNIVAINKNNQIITEGDNNFSNSMNFQKKRPAGIKNGNELGYITFEGTDTDNNMRRGSFIYSTAEGDFTSTSAPANIRFHTTSPGAVVPNEKMRLTSDGKLGIGTSTPVSTLDIGPNGKICFGAGKCISAATASLGNNITWTS